MNIYVFIHQKLKLIFKKLVSSSIEFKKKKISKYLNFIWVIKLIIEFPWNYGHVHLQSMHYFIWVKSWVLISFSNMCFISRVSFWHSIFILDPHFSPRVKAKNPPKLASAFSWFRLFKISLLSLDLTQLKNLLGMYVYIHFFKEINYFIDIVVILNGLSNIVI